ncbi:TIGR02677 family protein [Nocardiopsis lambiniae]|uniref:TIGR02677 family protein n=1 Tax=Nocardiopsis lambiniae TaxID=3075539 RepID=A0ABU2MBL5_9ACTN|nr:TIGR02677 family protein [Nocardiopsis sp. DSM 44743]MDT0329994.1 TIGR02677 family protein [Nocardiopsis sp. DSM 44743]
MSGNGWGMHGFERLPARVFDFTVGGRRDLYFAILHVFNDANERLETALLLEQVHARLPDTGFGEPVEQDEVEAALRHLETLGLVESSQSYTAGYATAAEFERKNVQYTLTVRGEAEFAGVLVTLERLKEKGALQTAVLDAVADRLGALHLLMGDDDPAADNRVFIALQELEGHLDSLRDNTKRFNNELQRLLRADGADLDTFHEVKRATVGYLDAFVDNLEERARTIADALARVEGHGVDRVLERALNGANLPPSAGDRTRADWMAGRRAKWSGLRLWFAPAADGQEGVRRLHEVARRAIGSLLETLERITESRRRASSTAEDLRTAARWFARSGTEEERHRLWSALTGLSPARHAVLGHEDGELIAPGTSWAAEEADPVPVSPNLRSSGRSGRVARTARVRDVREVGERRRERALAQRAEVERARRLLATDGPVRLSAFGGLEHDVFEELLSLLGRALSEPVSGDGARRALTSDGRMEIVLLAAGDGRVATLRTPLGVFTGPDHVVSIGVPGAAAVPEGEVR